MIEKKKSGNNFINKSFTNDSSKQSEFHNDEGNEINGLSSTQKTTPKLELEQDQISISNHEGALKRRKLFEIEELELGSTFKNINQRKDQYLENAEGECEENIFKQDTSQRLISSLSKKEINQNRSAIPFKYSDTIILDQSNDKERRSKQIQEILERTSIDKLKLQQSGDAQEGRYNEENNYDEEDKQSNIHSNSQKSSSNDTQSPTNKNQQYKNKKMSKQVSSQNSDNMSQQHYMTESQYQNSPFTEKMMNQLGLPGLKKDGKGIAHQNKMTSLEKKQTFVAGQTEKKRANFLNVLFYITKFKRKMGSKINLKQFISLKFWHFKLINDQTHFIKNEEEEKQEQLNRFFQRIKTFSPTSFVVVVWHLIILLILLIQLFFIPMKAGFSLKLDKGFWMYFLRILPAVAFSIEILLKFNTGYYEEGQIVMDRRKIISSYIKWKFWIDLSATTSILANQSIDSMWLDFIQFLHIQQITNLLDFLDDHFQISQRFQTAFELVKLVFLIVVVAHFCGCAFHLIAQIEIQNGSTDTWLQVKELQDEQWLVRYINSLYWAIITMNTVGYGDISPNTAIEKSYVTGITIVCCGVFGYAINTIGSIVREIALKEAAYKQIKYDISMYMRNRNISREVQLKVFKILQYQNQQEQEGTQKATQILERVPNTIQNEVYMEFYGKILHQCKLFRFNFTEKFINALSLKMMETTIGPGEILFKQGEQDSRIFFLLKGEVELFVTQGINDERERKFQLTKISTGSFFGHSEFFTDQVRQFSCQANTTCNLVSLTYKDSVSMIKEYQKDYENFCKLRDNLLLYGNQIDQKCLSCNQFTHSILDCPLVHLSLDKEFILKKNNFNIYQERDVCKRTSKQIKTLLHNQDIRYLLRKIRIDTVCEQRPDYQENVDDCFNETDQEFLAKTPIIKYHFGENQEELQISEDSDDEDLELEKDLEEVRSNLQTPFGNMQHDNLLHMNSSKSNSQLKGNINNINPNNNINANSNNSSTPNSRNIQTQQNEFSNFQKQSSMQNVSTLQQNQQTRRLTVQSSYMQQQLKQHQQVRDQNQQSVAQQQLQHNTTNSQKSLSSMTELQLQPQGSSTIAIGAIQQLAQQTQQSHNQVTIFSGSPTGQPNVGSVHLGNSGIVSFSTSTDKIIYNSHTKVQNSNLLNVDSNDIYQPSQSSKKSQQQKNIMIEDNKSVVSSRSAKSGGKSKEIDKYDSFVQKSPEEQPIKKEITINTLFGILDFEVRKDYEFYFPHNNLSKILEKIKKKAEVKLIDTLNVALNIGNIQMRKAGKSNNLHKIKLPHSSSRLNHKNEHHLSVSTSNIGLEQLNHNQSICLQSPSRFKNKI